jgi:histone-lysine N-methyltransferase SETMAR
MEHPPCSPELTPNDFWLFTKIKSDLKGRRFQDIEDIQNEVTTAQKNVPQQFNSFQQWQHRWAKCIAAQGEYFEGDPYQ